MADLSFDELSSIYKFFSRAVGVLTFEGRSFDFIGTRFLVAFMILNTMIDVGMFIGYDIEGLMKGRAVKAEDMYMTILASSLASRFYILLWSREDNAVLFEKCAQLWQFCDARGRATVKRYEHKIRLVYGIYAGSGFLTNILTPLGAYFVRIPAVEPNGTEQRMLPYIWFVEAEPYKYLGYHATFILQTFVVEVVIFIGIVADATVAGFAMLAAGYFRQLKDRLIECSEHEHEDYHEVVDCIKYHQRLLEFCKNLKDFSRTLLLVQILSSCYSISLILLKLGSSDPDKYGHTPMIVVCVLQLFLIQWTPERLANESEGVAFAVYSLVTKRLQDKRLRRDLQVMLARAQIPVELKAGGIVHLSLEQFAAMMKGAFSFFMVLRTFDLQ